MISSRPSQAMLAFMLIFTMMGLLAGSATATQRSQGRVLSNEDIESAPPPPAPAATSSTENSAAPSDAAQPPAATDRDSITLEGNLKSASAFQAMLNQAYEENEFRKAREQDPALQKRWTDMSLWIMNLLSANQQTIEEIQAKLGIQPPPAETEPTEPAASPEQAPAQEQSQPAPSPQ